MADSIFRITSIQHLHQLLGLSEPKHPLISVIDTKHLQISEEEMHMRFVYEFYMISIKDKNCGVEYGRNTFDFENGVMTFSSPGQIYKSTKEIQKGEIEGWMLFFHEDLIRKSPLVEQIQEFSFFNYDVFEALHLSQEEEKTVEQTVLNIVTEYNQRIDKHSQKVILANLELLLNYCLRYYERQFNTRTNYHSDKISNFEKQLSNYFKQSKHIEIGVPNVDYFAKQAYLSTHYFSDLIKKETGKTPKDHINTMLINYAKNMMLNSSKTISEIAYALGFNYPHYFTRFFKTKTGHTPKEYRNLFLN